MIIHRYADGSEGYEYQVGDRVIVKRTIHGGWFDVGPCGAEFCAVSRIEPFRKGEVKSWRTNIIDVSHSPDWGTTSCMPWHLEPYPDTYEKAEVHHVQGD